MDWLDLFAAQGSVKSFSAPQFKSINSFVLWLLGDCKNLAPPAACLPRRRGAGPGVGLPHSRGARAREAGSRGRESLRQACVAVRALGPGSLSLPSWGRSCSLSPADAPCLANTRSRVLATILEGVQFLEIHFGTEGGAGGKGWLGTCLSAPTPRTPTREYQCPE